MTVPVEEVVEKWGDLAKWFLDNLSVNLKKIVDPPPGGDVPTGAVDALALAVTGHIKVGYTLFETIGYLTTQSTEDTDAFGGPFYTADAVGARTLTCGDLTLGANTLPGKEVTFMPAATLQDKQKEFHIKARIGTHAKGRYTGWVTVQPAAPGSVAQKVFVSIIL
jgi:hypothetical protein